MSISPVSTPLDTGAAGSSISHKPSKLHQAAQQFEALMVNEMMKTARDSGDGGWMGSGDETGSDTAVEMAESQFSQALASSGGLGLARMIEKNLGPHSSDHSQPAQNESVAAGKLSIGPRP